MILQQELDMLKRENNTRIEEMNALIESKKKSDSLKAHTIARNNFLQSQLQKSEEKRNEALLKCKERDTELTALKKSLEEVKRDVKQKTQANINLEKRVQQLVSESEILKTEISKLKEYEKVSEQIMKSNFEFVTKMIMFPGIQQEFSDGEEIF